MTRLPRGITARLFVKALLNDGFVQIRTKGSHRIFRHTDGRRVIVAYHKISDTFPVGTLNGMIEDTGWSKEDLIRLKLLQLLRSLYPEDDGFVAMHNDAVF